MLPLKGPLPYGVRFAPCFAPLRALQAANAEPCNPQSPKTKPSGCAVGFVVWFRSTAFSLSVLRTQRKLRCYSQYYFFLKSLIILFSKIKSEYAKFQLMSFGIGSSGFLMSLLPIWNITSFISQVFISQ